MALKRRLITGKTYHPVKRIKTRAQTQVAISFWRLPRELRDIIYGLALEGPLTPLEPVHSKFGPCLADGAGLGPTCKRMHEEVTQHITKNVEVRVHSCRLSDERNKRILTTCRQVTIFYDPIHHRDDNQGWQKELAEAISDRKDIKTFRFTGIGAPILAYLYRTIRDDPFGVFAVVDLLAFERIMVMLSTFPRVRAKEHVKVTWYGDDKLPEGEEYVAEYRRMVKRIEDGHGGSKAGMSIRPRFIFDSCSYEY
jgi:hypothetical protein